MYLKEILLENVGSINFLDLSLPFNEDNTPQPIVVVGSSGSGKSIFLSYIVDALIEFAKLAYLDIVPEQTPMLSHYFKISGGSNQKLNSEFSIGLLDFIEEDRKYSYVDKTGKLDVNSYRDKTKGRFELVHSWNVEGNHKVVAPQDKNFFEKCFYQNAFCYFPSNRREIPHWLNRKGIISEPVFKIEGKYNGQLKKPICIESSLKENKSWILDVFLDSMVDFDLIQTENNQQSVTISNDWQNKYQLKQSRKNVEDLLKAVLQDPLVRLAINYRNITPYRLCIARKNQIIIPALDNLSSGQSILFNLFATIIRYADKADINNSIQLQNIKGIVLIDEIDAHLDTNLQYEVLPKLLKLFPKVQFIVTTHSPLFILGMEQQYGANEFQIIEMPSGNQITTERFSEFQKSFDYYKKTKAFEDEVEKTITNGTKPLVLTEGETDLKYIKTALELLGYHETLNKIDIEWVGTSTGQGKNLNTGDTGLNNTKKVFVANPELLNRKLLLLYDCDTNKPPEDIENLRVRQIPKQQNAKAKKGIENLLPNELFESRFYQMKQSIGDYGEAKQIQEFKKMEFCTWICEDRKNVDDFINFDVVVNILKDFLDGN